MTGQELRDRREEADVSRGELALRLPDLSAQMIQRIEEGHKGIPETYPAELGRILKQIGDERKAAADRAAAKLLAAPTAEQPAALAGASA